MRFRSGSAATTIGLPTSVQVVPLVVFWTTNDVSVIELSFQVKVSRVVVCFPVDGVCQPIWFGWRQRQGHRPHHIHFFMAQDMAVVGILPTEVDQLVYDGLSGCQPGSTLLNIAVSPSGIIGLSSPDVFGTSNGTAGDDGAEGHDRILERADPHSVLPAKLSCIWRDDDIVPGDPVEHLHIVQVEVDGVCIHAVVGDLPDLRAVCRRGDGGYLDTTLLGRLVASISSVEGSRTGRG